MKKNANFLKLFNSVLVISLSLELISCKALDSKKDCVAEDEDSCEELRINENNGSSVIALGDATITTSGSFLGANDRLAFEIKSPSTVKSCGGTIVSRVYYWNLKKAETVEEKEVITQRARKTLNSLQYLSIRTKEVIANRNETLYAIVSRGVPSSKLYYVDSQKYKPTGASAEGQKNVDFYTREVDASYYLVQAAAECIPLPAQEQSEDPDHEEEIAAESFN